MKISVLMLRAWPYVFYATPAKQQITFLSNMWNFTPVSQRNHQYSNMPNKTGEKIFSQPADLSYTNRHESPRH